MNQLYKLGLPAMFLLVASCSDYEQLAFSVDKPESVVLQEDIDSYDALTSYVNREVNGDFKLGGAVSLSNYLQKGVMYRLLNRNFDEITLGYEMKHGAVVQSDGSLALGNVEELLSTAADAGMSVYGHTLAWHANQNASYLNGLIAPLIVKSPPYANEISNSGLLDGSWNGWGRRNPGAGISISETDGMGGSVPAVKLTAGAGSSSPTDLQLVSPDIQVTPGKQYVVVCYIKSDIPGEGRISFNGLIDNTPQLDWMNTGMATETFTTDLSWKEIRFQIGGFEAESFNINFDLGYVGGVTYYLDIKNIYIYDPQGAPVVNNLIANGDFEASHIGGWGGWGNNSERDITASGDGYGGVGYALKVTNPSAVNFWEVQSVFGLGAPLEQGVEYVLSFQVRHDSPNGNIRPEFQSASWQDGADAMGTVFLAEDWTKVELRVTPTRADRVNLIISYGEMMGTVYLDNFVLSKADVAGGGEETVVERTPQEKEVIISGALEHWIAGMLEVTKPHVNAWDVVNEPMDDGQPYELKTGAGRGNLAPDEFFWQDYLGKSYALKAFELARQYGNPDDIHFINDYNLEYNLDKCKGLIAYVEYLEERGAKIDGIGTQMHISIDSDKEKIAEMFRLLAATGKLVKVSELDIGVGVPMIQATEFHYQAQAELYKYVVEKYMELIPTAQQYGITIWSPLDSAQGSSWRAGEPIGLWTEGYVRKPAYSAVAEALQQH